MTQGMRKPRRWPWILGCVVALLGGLVGGAGVMSYATRSILADLHIPCPPVYEPMPGEMVFRRAPGIILPRPMNELRDQRVPAVGRFVRVNGTVQILFRVERDGRVSRIVLGRSSGFCPYDVHALRQARDVRFLPGQRQGVPAAGWIPLNITYLGGSKPARMTPRAPDSMGI